MPRVCPAPPLIPPTQKTPAGEMLPLGTLSTVSPLLRAAGDRLTVQEPFSCSQAPNVPRNRPRQTCFSHTGQKRMLGISAMLTSTELAHFQSTDLV